jgi:hypothetical protein
MAIASNTLLTNDLITRQALRILRNKFVLASRSLRNVDDLFGKVGMKAGDTVRVRIPVRYTSVTGAAVNKQNAVETQTSITLTQRNIGMGFLSKDRTLSIDDFSKRFIEPAMAQLASDIDQDGFALYYKAQNLVTPGSYSAGIPAAWTGADLATLRPFLDAKARMFEKSVPDDDKLYVAVTPAATAGVVDGLKGLFQSASDIADQYKRGLMGLAAGFEWCQAQTLPTHTAGTRTNTTPLIDGAQTGSSILLKGAGNAVTVTRGDQFTIGGVFSINPLTRTATNKLQVFTVQTAATSGAGGAVTVSVVPSINVTAPNQTVSAQAADGATVTWQGGASAATDVNLAWHESAFLVAFCDLETNLPGAEASKVTDPESGITLRMVGQHNVETDETVYRLDVLYGWQIVRGEHVCRIQG